MSLVLPTLIIGSCLYYVIFNIMAEQLGIPEVVAYQLLPVVRKVNLILMISLPVVFFLLLYIGLILTRNLVGPIERLEGELEEIISGDLSKRLRLRKKDRLKPLVDSINVLLDKIEKTR
jgi:methyl-accepting chemotaxis protein